MGRTVCGSRPAWPEAAKRVMQAIEHITADAKLHTRDPGGTATTADVTRAVCEEIAATKYKRLDAR